MTGKERPVIAITIGDPAGIGPEVVAKALANKRLYEMCRPLVIGESAAVRAAIELISKPLTLHLVEKASETSGKFGAIDILDMHNIEWHKVKVGKVSAECGRAAMEFIEKALQLALNHEVRGMVNAPINKEATLLAGYPGLGHLDYLAMATGVKEYATMLAVGNLRCVHLTTHYSLKEACDQVKKERVLGRLKLTDASFRKWGFGKPIIGVAGLNPHAGEDGMFGREEMDEIAPAIREAVSLGLDARGPFPADSIFNRAINGEFDAVLVMYHDQGHIPVKVYGFEKSVSVALGLPFLRTSVDHGTAFDIAGKGIANAESMEEAIRTAVWLSEGKGLTGKVK
ncbi:MAG: 4-hydroxythreonine-4-phosphate dehydrogenase PdxA [Dehalococcoidales bacterium]|nr:4-hydroxythreonine-4-phosphate dehydrogenase PdxA [Dehalococcoidales bacterium]